MVYTGPDETVFALTTSLAAEAPPQRSLQLARETGAPKTAIIGGIAPSGKTVARCETLAPGARLSRSHAIFLFEQQRPTQGGKASLPDLESHDHPPLEPHPPLYGPSIVKLLAKSKSRGCSMPPLGLNGPFHWPVRFNAHPNPSLNSSRRYVIKL
jgi:hypothetical protein